MFLNILMDEERFFILGAIYNNNVIAQASLELKPQSKKHRHVGTWGIAIHPDFQNQGLGVKLLEIIENIAKERSVKKLEVEYYDGNKSAEELYLRKMNYKIEGRRKYGVLLKNGKYSDKICIGKILDDSIKKN